ncbi:porin family protein [Roseivirga sp.]|uniref:porin family protein n=1 Tax=Roseivirga sp. TaxID=1964215 RepID=UPI002B270897|nr:porin family protein [Roseivirga sp.]
MKKIIITSIFSLLSLVAFTSQSQAQEFRSGIKGSFNLSNFYSNDIDDNNLRPGFSFGVFNESQIGPTAAIQTEFLFSTKGNRSEYRSGPFNGEAKFNLNYLELPVMLDLKAGSALDITFGPYVSYLVSANVTTEGDFGSSYSEIDRDELKAFDFGFSGGLGLNFGNTELGARYNLGLTEIANSNNARSVMGDAKNSVIQFYIALGM